MSHKTATSRRSFLKSSALITAPLAAVSAPAVALAADDTSAARLARLEDERAIEGLARAFLKDARGAKLRKLAGRGETLRALAADPAAEPSLAFAADGRSATLRKPCIAQVAREFDGDTAVEQMARLQGNAADLRSKRCTILADFLKAGGEWTLASARLA